MTPVDLRLNGILDPEHTLGRHLGTLADEAVLGGVTLLQYRDKFSDTRKMIARGREIHAALAGRIPLLVNDRVDVALAIGAEGVHLGREDMLPADARHLLGTKAIIGVTLKNSADIAAIDPALVNYGCIGGVFATSSKDNPDNPVGLEGLARLRLEARAYGLPIGAIAGITPANAAATILAGADGIALISAIFSADDPRKAALELRTIVDTALKDRGLAG